MLTNKHLGFADIRLASMSLEDSVLHKEVSKTIEIVYTPLKHLHKSNKQ